jgi:hypothetical protein
MVLIGCPEELVRNYHFSQCSNSEEHSSHVFHGRSLKIMYGESVVTSNFKKYFYCAYLVQTSGKEHICITQTEFEIQNMVCIFL